MTSIVRADVTRDLKHAKIYVSVLGSKKEINDTICGLNSASGFIKKELGALVKLRNIPELHFIPDDSIEYGIHMAKVLDDLDLDKDNEK